MTFEIEEHDREAENWRKEEAQLLGFSWRIWESIQEGAIILVAVYVLCFSIAGEPPRACNHPHFQI